MKTLAELNLIEHKYLRIGDIEDLNCSDIEELLIKGHHIDNCKIHGYSGSTLDYAVNYIGLDLMDIMYYPNTDSWGF